MSRGGGGGGVVDGEVGGGGEGLGLLPLLLGHHEALDVGRVDHPVLDLELVEGVVYLIGGELLAPGHQGVPEPAPIQIG